MNHIEDKIETLRNTKYFCGYTCSVLISQMNSGDTSEQEFTNRSFKGSEKMNKSLYLFCLLELPSNSHDLLDST
jgi:hypothetical protein